VSSTPRHRCKGRELGGPLPRPHAEVRCPNCRSAGTPAVCTTPGARPLSSPVSPTSSMTDASLADLRDRLRQFATERDWTVRTPRRAPQPPSPGRPASSQPSSSGPPPMRTSPLQERPRRRGRRCPDLPRFAFATSRVWIYWRRQTGRSTETPIASRRPRPRAELSVRRVRQSLRRSDRARPRRRRWWWPSARGGRTIR